MEAHRYRVALSRSGVCRKRQRPVGGVAVALQGLLTATLVFRGQAADGTGGFSGQRYSNNGGLPWGWNQAGAPGELATASSKDRLLRELQSLQRHTSEWSSPGWYTRKSLTTEGPVKPLDLGRLFSGSDPPDGQEGEEGSARSQASTRGYAFYSPPEAYVQQPDPMDAVRALAVKMEEEDRSEVAHYMATILQKLANMNELFLGEKARKDTVFHSSSMPTVAVAEFVERVANNIACPNLCLILTLVYMDRLALPSSELHLYVTPLTAHRLFAASLIIAIKFLVEKPPSILNDRFYSKMHVLTGLEVTELKHLEHHMLQALAKDARVSAQELAKYMTHFALKHEELVPYVDRPYLGPPLFPFQ